MSRREIEDLQRVMRITTRRIELTDQFEKFIESPNATNYGLLMQRMKAYQREKRG